MQPCLQDEVMGNSMATQLEAKPKLGWIHNSGKALFFLIATEFNRGFPIFG